MSIRIIGNMYWEMEWKSVWLFANPWTVAHQAPLSMERSRKEYWNGLPCPPPGNETWVSCIAGGFLTSWGNVNVSSHISKQSLSPSPAIAATKDGELVCRKRTRKVKIQRKLRKWKDRILAEHQVARKSQFWLQVGTISVTCFFCFCFFFSLLL